MSPSPAASAATPVSDALDRLIIHDAEASDPPAGTIIVLDDHTGSLTAWAMERVKAWGSGAVLVRCRDLREARAVARLSEGQSAEAQSDEVLNNEAQSADVLVTVAGLDGAPGSLEEFLATHVKQQPVLAIGRLPKALSALEEWATGCARHGVPRLILGGANKHMTKSMNAVIEHSFSEVHGLRGKGKNRCLEATVPKEGVHAYEPATQEYCGARLHGHGGVFSGAKPDRGGQALAAAAVQWLERRDSGSGARTNDGNTTGDGGRSHLHIVDLGCGNGTVTAAMLASGHTGVRIAATDVDLDAVLSASRAMKGNSAVTVTWDDAASALEAGTQDLVLLNPPFHEGTRIDPTLVQPLLDASARLLRPGGTLLFVHNAHLRYRPVVEQRFGTVTQVSRDATFTVLEATR
ncbi:methyltransferase [Corynebacterium sp. 320]|uniref:class I SAM-dependent methyltransferase n=1 Tax=Corynebacterium TaxID=1716 RepID=UPI00125CBB87|nr:MULTISPECIES: methyltransferase [Corynebacterium]KAB1502813.1 methyltransferase [Corynebacterium sp. 320]KAB3526476.1 methyltransferase [Corynebacterium sp. 250]QNP92265.1 methyltransferase [Corynebacterium zhongnanshanii]